MDNTYQQVGKTVQKLRKQNKLTQAGLAEKAGLSDNFIGLIERGVGHPTLETLAKIAKALEVEISDLFPSGIDKNPAVAYKKLTQMLSKRGFRDAPLLLNIYKTFVLETSSR